MTRRNSHPDDPCDDELYITAVKLAKARGKASVSSLQRGLCIGYNHASSILEAMKVREHLVQGITKFTWVWPSAE